MARDRGTIIALSGVVLLVATLVISGALAPQRTVEATETTETTETLIGVQGAGAGFHESGNVQLRNGSEQVWERTDADSYFEVEQLGDGSVVAAFIDGGYQDCGDFESPCPRTGYRVVEPGADGSVLSEWTFPVRNKKDSELHAVEPLPDGGFAVVDMDAERLAVVENGTVAWEWTADEFYEAPPDPTLVDWLHMNDVDYIGDDRFLLSVRNANQILVIERPTGVVEVINEDRGVGSEESCRTDGELVDYDDDGEVRCGNPDLIHRQHNPQWLGNGSVLVADSENDRAVELHRGANGTWQEVWSLERAGGLALDWPRDADRLPSGHTLVSDTFNKRVVEIDENGTVVWSVGLEENPYEVDRLPVGEQTDVPTYGDGESAAGDDSGTAASDGGDVPVLTTLVVALHSGIPGLPYWVGELQVLGTLVSLGLVGAGLVVRYRDGS
ncbi:MAG: hypothetical protein ACI8XM_001143 [Haloarculaceae archaeon]|jgi:hypothetical protein